VALGGGGGRGGGRVVVHGFLRVLGRDT
jgi:hypothetical protein